MYMVCIIHGHGLQLLYKVTHVWHLAVYELKLIRINRALALATCIVVQL